MYVIRDINELVTDLTHQLNLATSDRVRLEAIEKSGDKYYSGKIGLRLDLAKAMTKQQSYQNAIEMVLALKRSLDLEQSRRFFGDLPSEEELEGANSP